MRKFKIFTEVCYNDQTDTKLLSDRGFTPGDISTIIECINQTTEEISRNYIAIADAARFFGIAFTFRGFTIYVTESDDTVVETLEVNDFEGLDRIMKLIIAMCN